MFHEKGTHMGAKLVRHKVGDIPWGNDEGLKRLLRPVKNRYEHNELLRIKLIEEAIELAGEHSRDGMVAEAADLLEALHALLGVEGITTENVRAVADAKFHERGGFATGVVYDWEKMEGGPGVAP